MTQEIWVVPFFGQGHLLPSMELCKQIASRSFKTTLIISSNLSSSVPTYLRHYPLLEVAELPSSPPAPPPPPPPPQGGSDSYFHHHHMQNTQMAQDLENLILTRAQNPHSRAPVCAVVDVMMDWSVEIFNKLNVPTIGFFKSGACSAAIEYAMWKANLKELKPEEKYFLPGLPEEMAITESDLEKPHGPPGHPGGRQAPPGLGGPLGPVARFPGPPPGCMAIPKMMGPPKPGDQPPWLMKAGGCIAYMINTCDDLEGSFIEFLASQIAKPVWGVGPLLPEQYWKLAGSLFHDQEVRSHRRSNVTEDEVITWLNSKPHGSVLYVAFGTEVGPKMEDYPQLADALEASNRAFIWVIQQGSGRPGPPPSFLGGQPGLEVDAGYFPHGLDKKVGERGLIIQGWAPQLLILSHPSTGGFLSHCGWNSTVEAIGRGVPILAWPIRGDQHYDAKLVVQYLKVGYTISNDLSGMVKKDDIIKGIEKLLGDEDVKKRAALLSAKFEHGFPVSSMNSLDAFSDFIKRKAV